MNQFADLLDDDYEVVEQAPAPLDSGPNFQATMKTSGVHDLQNGVTLNWLTQAFRLTRKQTIARLAKCPVLRAGQNGTKVYEFKVACSYMVDPRMSVAEYLETIGPNDLPKHLTKEYWGAKLQEQNWRTRAGELWASEDVIAVFGEMFKLIKTKSQLWGDSIDKVEVLSDAQRNTLQTLVDDLIGQIFNALVDLESGKATPSQLAEVDDDDTEEA